MFPRLFVLADNVMVLLLPSSASRSQRGLLLTELQLQRCNTPKALLLRELKEHSCVPAWFKTIGYPPFPLATTSSHQSLCTPSAFASTLNLREPFRDSPHGLHRNLHPDLLIRMPTTAGTSRRFLGTGLRPKHTMVLGTV